MCNTSDLTCHTLSDLMSAFLDRGRRWSGTGNLLITSRHKRGSEIIGFTRMSERLHGNDLKRPSGGHMQARFQHTRWPYPIKRGTSIES